MTNSANRSRRRTAAGLLVGAALVASCIEIKDAPAKKSATTATDSAGGAVVKSPMQQSSGRAPTFGPDSVTHVRGGPLETPAAQAELQSDTAHTLRDIDTSVVAATAASDANALKGNLLLPVRGIATSALSDTYDDQRGGGTRTHEALDIPAPRGTPVLSAASGRVLKLFDSQAGGQMVYAADSSERFIFMYGHLDSYAPGLAEGQPLTRGQVIGAVGTTGNAPPNLPHLHFAIARSSNVKEWWKGSPVNPYPLLVP